MTTPLALVMLVDDEVPFVETMTKRLAALQKDFGQDFVDLGVINAAGEQIA